MSRPDVALSLTPPRTHLRRGVVLAAGLAMTTLGLAAPLFPLATSIAIGLAAGWLLWFAGAVMFGLSVLTLQSRLRLSGVLAALVVIGAGVYLTFNPTTGALATAILLAAVFVTDGSFQVALALNLRPHAAWRWVLASAFASLIAAGLFAAGGSGGSSAGIAALLAAALLTTGMALIAVSLSKLDPAT